MDANKNKRIHIDGQDGQEYEEEKRFIHRLEQFIIVP